MGDDRGDLRQGRVMNALNWLPGPESCGLQH